MKCIFPGCNGETDTVSERSEYSYALRKWGLHHYEECQECGACGPAKSTKAAARAAWRKVLSDVKRGGK